MPQIGHGSALFDDTPVNGEIEKGITSNWAYDEDVTLRALIEAATPWLISIDPFMTPKDQLNMGTLSLSVGLVHQASIGPAGSINDFISWDVLIPKGTWTIEAMFNANVNKGIVTVQFDGVTQGTIDNYAGTGTPNSLASIAGLVVATTSKKELKLIVLSKNDLSSNYYIDLQAIRLMRTA